MTVLNRPMRSCCGVLATKPVRSYSRRNRFETWSRTGGDCRQWYYWASTAAIGPADCLRVEGRWIQGDWINSRAENRSRTALLVVARNESSVTRHQGVVVSRVGPAQSESRVQRTTERFSSQWVRHVHVGRTLETIAVTADVPQPIIDTIMGHTDRSMGAVYRQKVFDRQLQKCSEHVRHWMLGEIELD